jgi:hypothetical protein
MVSPQAERHVPTLLSPILLAALAAAVLAGPASQAEEPGLAPPRAVFSSVVHDAGPVERGELITHEFTFRNSGGSDLIILSTKAG